MLSSPSVSRKKSWYPTIPGCWQLSSTFTSCRAAFAARMCRQGTRFITRRWPVWSRSTTCVVAKAPVPSLLSRLYDPGPVAIALDDDDGRRPKLSSRGS